MIPVNPIESWTEHLADRPAIFPHQLNLINDTLLLAELSSAEIKAASFLDQRVLKQTTKGNWIPWKPVADVFNRVPDRELPGFIFHVGHCGSTLLSRLLEFAENTQSLREPLPLRTLAQDLADSADGRSFLTRQARLDRLRVLSKMWSRGARHTVIKATSICTDLLTQIYSLQADTRSIFVYNRAETHVATLLAGQNALIDLRGFAQLRLQRLRQITGLDLKLNELSTSQLAALSWLSETTSAARSLEKHAPQIALLEFESLLQDPGQHLSRLLAHLKIDTPSETVEKALSSPVLQTYSKAPEHQYNAQTRAAILQDSRSRFGQEIKTALAWMESLAGRSELVATALQKFC
jgi:hypothetical protein